MKIKLKYTKLLIIAFGIISIQHGFCQENYLPGYVVTLEEDTIHGLLDYRNWNNNPKKIHFKNDIAGARNIYTPIDIKLFSVKDEIYLSAIVETEVSPYKSSTLEYDPELQIEADTVFLQTMIQGIKSLYHYKDSYGKDNFYIKQNEGFDLLVYKKYLKIHEGTSVVLENKKYTGQLTLYLQDCPTIKSKLNNTNYNKNNLEKLLLSYYECTLSVIKFQKKTETLKLEIGVLAGISISSLKFRSDDYPYLENADYSNSLNFSGGIFFDIIIPRAQRKWSICNELIYTSFSMEDRYIRNTIIYKYVYDTKLAYDYLKMNNLLRFKYPIGSFFVFANIGLSTGVVIKETNYLKKETKIVSTTIIEEGKCIPQTDKIESGYILGLGSKYKKFSFEVRYEKGTSMAHNIKSISKRYYFLLGYRF